MTRWLPEKKDRQVPTTTDLFCNIIWAYETDRANDRHEGADVQVVVVGYTKGGPRVISAHRWQYNQYVLRYQIDHSSISPTESNLKPIHH